MDEMTQQNAALVEEAAAAARAMQEQAAELTRQMGFFQLGDNAAVKRSMHARTSAVTAETEAVFAAVRSKGAAPVTRSAGLKQVAAPATEWAEF
jgi:methyl-accepting chemotaxis protein-1 (serine sensor receptor)